MTEGFEYTVSEKLVIMANEFINQKLRQAISRAESKSGSLGESDLTDADLSDEDQDDSVSTRD